MPRFISPKNKSPRPREIDSATPHFMQAPQATVRMGSPGDAQEKEAGEVAHQMFGAQPDLSQQAVPGSAKKYGKP